MRKLKILLYADVDLNIMDGSAIWLTSICNVLNRDENIFVDVILKARIKTDVILSEIAKLPQVNIIDTFIKFTDIQFKNNNRIDVEEAVEIIQHLEKLNQYDCIIIRGFELSKEMLRTNLMHKTIPYITNFTHSQELISAEEREDLQKIYATVTHMFTQTEAMKQLLMDILNVDGDKFQLLLPMIPDYIEIPAFKIKSRSLVYTGKFDDKWYTEETVNAFFKLRDNDKTIKLNIAGDKFQKSLFEKKDKLTRIFKEDEGIEWIGAVSRTDSNKLIEESDIGIAWRSEEIDNDSSVELSTKLLEYGRLGKPAIVRRTKLHEELLGKDYFLFIDSEISFVDKTLKVLNDSSLYRKLAKHIYESCKKYTYKESYINLKPVFWSYKHKKIKLVFAGHDLKFIDLAIEYFSNHPQYEVRIDKWSGHNKHDLKESRSCLEWADVIFCEWGLGNAVWYSNNKHKGQKLIVRMHAQEKNTGYYNDFKMYNISKIIVVSPYMFEEFSRICNLPREKMKVISNMIDTDKFNKPKYSDEKLNFNIGIVGIIPSLKRFDIALDLLEELWNKDERYTLYVRSKLPQDVEWLKNREEEQQYYKQLFNRIENARWSKNVVFDKPGHDMDQWFRKIGYVLSTSDFESFHLAPMEGMSSGSIPLIINRIGADTIFPKKYIFNNHIQMADYIINNKYLNIQVHDLEIIKQFTSVNYEKEKILRDLEKTIFEV